MEYFRTIVDCVTMAYVACSFVVLLEIANRLKSNDNRFDKLYERSSCPPHKESKTSWYKRFTRKLRARRQNKS